MLIDRDGTYEEKALIQYINALSIHTKVVNF